MPRPDDDARPPLVWRLPAYLPALLLLVVCACAAVNIYGSPSAGLRAFTLALALAALAAAVSALRMYLWVDDDGIEVRRVRRPVAVPWPEVASVVVAQHISGSATLRVELRDGRHVDVPPSLLQPARPISKPRALGRLRDIANAIAERRP